MNQLSILKITFKSLCLDFLLVLSGMLTLCNNSYGINNDSTQILKNRDHKFLNLEEYLQIFYPLQNDAEYAVTVCADLPVNNNPNCVFKKGEPGHTFLILSKYNPLTGEVITRSFGFYPRTPISSIFVKKVRSKILDNANREYDASLEKKLTTDEFALVIKKCIELAKKKYNLNKYNCYDYVLEVFNSLPGIEKLPLSKIKFPFIFGRGGSPCGLYSDLQKLSLNGSSWMSFIRFGIFKSPDICTRQNLVSN